MEEAIDPEGFICVSQRPPRARQDVMFLAGEGRIASFVATPVLGIGTNLIELSRVLVVKVRRAPSR